MTQKKHPDTSTILTYAAGAVREGFSLVLTAHMESCKQCREKVANAEELGGELLSALPPVRMSDNDLTKIWEIIAAEPALEPDYRPDRVENDLPTVLAPIFPGGISSVKWRTLIPGIKQQRLTNIDSGQGSVRLLCIDPGTKVPHHTHLGSELTLVLQGSYSDETGHFRSGDLADLDASIQHQPIVDSEQPCICLIATDQRLRFTGTLNRLLQPLIGI